MVCHRLASPLEAEVTVGRGGHIGQLAMIGDARYPWVSTVGSKLDVPWLDEWERDRRLWPSSTRKRRLLDPDPNP